MCPLSFGRRLTQITKLRLKIGEIPSQFVGQLRNAVSRDGAAAGKAQRPRTLPYLYIRLYPKQIHLSFSLYNAGYWREKTEVLGPSSWEASE